MACGREKKTHEDSEVVTKVTNLMKKHVGDLTVTRGNKHRFLGMNVTMRSQKK